MQSNWYLSRTAQHVKALLENGFSYACIEHRCQVPRWRIVEVVKQEKCGVRNYRNGQTKEAVKRIDAMLRQIREMRRAG